VPDHEAGAVTDELQRLADDGLAPRHLAYVLGALAEERAAAQQLSDRVELVCSPPELDHVDARDTAVVVQDLFRRAKHDVLVATFAIDAGAKAEAIFGELAARMDAEPGLRVRLFLNVHRVQGDERPSAQLVWEFAIRFREKIWPGQRLPEVFYDPRSVELDGPKRAVLHAKVVVVDGRWTLITSANFTEAAQERNIEVGLLMVSTNLARRVAEQLATSMPLPAN
jgi:phosphatidylserine/phosphatidylglycerophosphate/cardiolipin synthase-like enzyme